MWSDPENTLSSHCLIFLPEQVDYSKNTILNLELLEMKTVSLNAILPSKSQQDVVDISSEDEKENIVTIFENKLGRFGN